MSLLSELLKGYNDRVSVPVKTPEWPPLDGKLFAVKLDPVEKQELRNVVSEEKIAGGLQFVATVVVRCIKDETGERVFADDEREWLQHKHEDAINRLFNECDRLNILTDERQQELVKNSEAPDVSKSI